MEGKKELLLKYILETMEFIPINMDRFKISGVMNDKKLLIPTGFELIIAEKDAIKDTAIVLYGFDEIGLFDKDFADPVYGYLKLQLNEK